MGGKVMNIKSKLLAMAIFTVVVIEIFILMVVLFIAFAIKVNAVPLNSVGDRLESQVLTDFQVTWYNNDGIDTTTATGTMTTEGITAAVDPKIIPYGTWFIVIMPDGTRYIRRAEDTGSAVKGKIVDIYAKAARSELISRGRTRGVLVKILTLNSRW
jgi:3D (Asp-Asp-Asp) domain-containing protein